MVQAKKDGACLIVHGFGGSPGEIEYLKKRLQMEGLDTYTASLAGHGGTRKDLTASSYPDWIESVKTAINRLTPEYNSINLIGFSLGGLICVHFASVEEVKKLVFINTPIRIWNFRLIFRDIISEFHGRKFDRIHYYKKSASAISIKSGVDFLTILSKTKKMFKDVSKPSLILQCRGDESAHYKSAGFIKEKLGDYGHLQYYEGGCHQVFTAAFDLRDKVCDDIYKFLVS